MIELRHPTLEDAEPLAAAVRESLADLEPWMEWATGAYDVQSAYDWIAVQAADREAGRAFEFLVTGAGGALLGCCGLNRVSARPLRIANLGYWIRTSAAGRGFAPEAARRVAEWAGARFEGVLRARLWTRGPQDALMYSLVRHNPTAPLPPPPR